MHRILYKPTGILLSSAIADVGVQVDGAFVDVTLTAPGSIVILAERYYAYGGNVTLYDIASLIEAHMRSSGYSYADFTLSVGSDSHMFHILYCDRFTVCTDVPLFLRENFLSTLPMRRVAPDATLTLFLFALPGDSLSFSVSYTARKIANGSLYRNSFSLGGGNAVSNSVQQLNLAISSIVADAASKATVRRNEIEILSFTITCGQRSVTCFVDRSLSTADSFAFRNCFNVWDIASLPTETKAKTDVDRSTAVINGSSRFYNQSVNKTYEVTAGPITSDEAEWIDQLFTSHEVLRFEPNDCDPDEPYILAPVLITDSTCEVSNSDEKPNSVKFSWRYADNRPIVRFSASRGIFTSPFNVVYS